MYHVFYAHHHNITRLAHKKVSIILASSSSTQGHITRDRKSVNHIDAACQSMCTDDTQKTVVGAKYATKATLLVCDHMNWFT